MKFRPRDDPTKQIVAVADAAKKKQKLRQEDRNNDNNDNRERHHHHDKTTKPINDVLRHRGDSSRDQDVAAVGPPPVDSTTTTTNDTALSPPLSPLTITPTIQQESQHRRYLVPVHSDTTTSKHRTKNDNSNNNSSNNNNDINKNSSSNNKDHRDTRQQQRKVYNAYLEDLEYPTQTVAVPSRAVVELYYQHALQQQQQERNDNSPLSPSNDSSLLLSHQAQLNELGVGILSLEDVLIPAVAHQEDRALRAFQSKVQRRYKQYQPSEEDEMEVDEGDAAAVPDVGALVQECRSVLFNSVGTAIQAARTARMTREEQVALEEARQAEICQQQREDERLEQARLRQMEQHRQREERKKKLPQNQDLWREVAYLMTGLSKLQKEERLWKEMEQSLLHQEEKQQQMEQQKAQVTTIDTTIPTAAAVVALDDVVEWEKRLDRVVESSTQSAQTIHAALQVVSDLIHESDQVQQELYHSYHQDHQFHGYASVLDSTTTSNTNINNKIHHNPTSIHHAKDLVKILSQDA